MKPVVVVFASIDWDFLFQRVQHVSQQFARAGYPVYYRNPSQIKGIAPQEIEKNLYVCKDFDLVDKSQWKNVIYVIYFPAFHQWVERKQNSLIIYDCADDFEEHDPHQEKMLKKSDIVFTSSIKLYENIKQVHDNVYLVRNGVDFEHFDIQRETPLDMLNAKKPVIGFSGSLNPRWVDLELLDHLIRRNPQWSFVFVGDKHNFSRSFENVFFLGMKKYDQLPKYVLNFDVGLIPFLDNRISQSTNPVKMYEYLAAGKPVVARALPETKAVKGLFLYSTESEAERAIRRAITEGTGNREYYKKFAASNSWKQRFDTMNEVILNKIKGKGW